MHTHQSGPDCTGCRSKTDTAHPFLSNWFWNVVKPKNPNAHVSWGWRGKVDQEKFFSQGKTRARWPDSPHNWMERENPCSLALDLFCLIDSIASWPKEFFEAINTENKADAIPIVWGGEFKTIGDGDHFQVDLSKIQK